MTSLERLNALLSGQPIDRIPFYLFARGFCAKCVGYDAASMYADPEKCFWAEQWTSEIYGEDLLPRFHYQSGSVLDFGGEIKYPNGEWSQAPSVTQYPVNSEEDVWKLELPDVRTAHYLAKMMEFCKLSERFGLPIIPYVGTPLLFAERLCGSDLLYRWMIRRPEAVHRLNQLLTEFLLEVVRLCLHTFGGEHLIAYEAAPVESNQVISPKQFKDFVLPHLKELNEKMLAMGVKHIFCHICGEQNLNLPYWTQIPMGSPGIISVGHEVDLATAIKYFGDTSIIAGNVEPAIIQEGTPKQVYELTNRCIEKAKHAPRGFILMPGCELPSGSPPYNVYMLKKAIDDFGWYA